MEKLILYFLIKSILVSNEYISKQFYISASTYQVERHLTSKIDAFIANPSP